MRAGEASPTFRARGCAPLMDGGRRVDTLGLHGELGAEQQLGPVATVASSNENAAK